MKQIKDKVKCERAIEKLELEKEFDTQNLEFQIYQYEKGELLCQPCNSDDRLQIVIEGTVNIYHIRDDGSKYFIAMEDILEEIVGNILDEYDEEDEMIQKQNDGSMIANGLTELEDLEDLIPVTFDKEDYETLNGFLIDELEHIPGEDEKCVVDYEGYRFTVLQVDNNIIQTVKIEKLPEA